MGKRARPSTALPPLPIIIPILAAGTLLTARALGMILVTSATVFALRRIGYRIPMFVGFSILIAGMVLLAITPPAGISAYLWLSIGGAITGLGVGSTRFAARVLLDLLSGTPTELWVGGTQLLPKDAMVAEATRRYRKARNAPR